VELNTAYGDGFKEAKSSRMSSMPTAGKTSGWNEFLDSKMYITCGSYFNWTTF